MGDADELVQRYPAAWNETDAAARRAVLAEVFAEDAAYTDPLVSVQGGNGLDAAIAAVQAQFGGLVFSLGGAVGRAAARRRPGTAAPCPPRAPRAGTAPPARRASVRSRTRV